MNGAAVLYSSALERQVGRSSTVTLFAVLSFTVTVFIHGNAVPSFIVTLCTVPSSMVILFCGAVIRGVVIHGDVIRGAVILETPVGWMVRSLAQSLSLAS